MITVVNKRTHVPTDHDIFCGRGSALGNPWTHMKGKTKALYICATREESIQCYAEWLPERIKQSDRAVCDALNEIYYAARDGDVNLVCYCSPDLDCHCRIIKQIVEEKLIQRGLKKTAA